MNVMLNAALQAQIVAQLEASYPNEGGGFLLGQAGHDSARISQALPVDNVFATAEQDHRYAMRPQDWMRWEDAAEAQGLSLLGYYHSHPDAPALPSEYDREHALPNFIYLITSVQAACAADMRAWQLRADRSAFDRLSLSIR